MLKQVVLRLGAIRDAGKILPMRRIQDLARHLGESGLIATTQACWPAPRIRCLLVTVGSVPIGDSSTSQESFIARAHREGIAALLGTFRATDRFDRVLESMSIVSMEAGRVEAEVEVVEGLLNAFGTLHGGATCTLIDVVGTLALLSLDTSRPGISVELNSTFISAAKAGERIKVVATVLKTGKRLGFTQVEIYGADGRLCATGRHTKAL